MVLAESSMRAVARDTLGINDKTWTAQRDDATFRAFLGAPIAVITDIWNRIEANLDTGAMPKHLLWMLVFIKVYSTELVHCSIVGWIHPQTYRKWTWYMLEKVAELKHTVIKLDNRFDGWDGRAQCLISVDGTDCPVNEPWPWEKKWYSKKFNGPAVKYEVGVCIATGYIVWIKGPVVASVNDSTLFKQHLAGLLAEDEGVEVDAGYKGHDALKAPIVAVSSVARKEKSVVRGRHENVNGRLKIFNMLNFPFRHLNPRDGMMKKHGLCFDAIAVVTQIKFEAREVLYGVNYDHVSYD